MSSSSRAEVGVQVTSSSSSSRKIELEVEEIRHILHVRLKPPIWIYCMDVPPFCDSMPISSLRLEVRVVGGWVEIIKQSYSAFPMPPPSKRHLIYSPIIIGNCFCDLICNTTRS